MFPSSSIRVRGSESGQPVIVGHRAAEQRWHEIKAGLTPLDELPNGTPTVDVPANG